MSEHFIKYIDIESYKCFRDFSAKGFQRVNLVSGKNNVGKTAMMESLMLNIYSIGGKYALLSILFSELIRKNSEYFGKTIDHRKINQDTMLKFKYIKQVSNVNSLVLERNDDTYRIHTSMRGEEYAKLEDITSTFVLESILADKVSYISGAGFSQDQIKKSFVAIQQQDREEELYQFIKEFDGSIENVKIIGGESIQCKVQDVSGDFLYRDLSDFGDGLKQYLSIILDFYQFKDGYVLIDEIENGIHYSMLDKLWEIIFSLSKEMNVQVFATTHSRECIESYCRVAEKLNDQEVMFATLVKNKNKQIKAITYDYEAFTNSIDQGHEVRGW